ncbi:hypothetical protein C8R47DRAFT_744525 [Mycena vitilis]|nr:hypothetical protein C8R47DRAFT_744525 [Mycena vitilis]
MAEDFASNSNPESRAGTQAGASHGRKPNGTPATYTLTCGAALRRPVVDVDPNFPYPKKRPKKYAIPMLPLPLEGKPSPSTGNGTTGCGTIIYVKASRGGNYWWEGAGHAAGPSVVLLPEIYFSPLDKQILGGVPRKEVCGCLTVGVGCCVCGNTLGSLTTRCEGHAKTTGCPIIYAFLADAVSPPIPPKPRNRKRITRIEESSANPPTAVDATTTAPTPALMRTFPWMNSWVRTPTGTRGRSPSPTPFERARRQQEHDANMQALADEAEWESQREEAERAVAAARFHASGDGPMTQDEFRAWTSQIVQRHAAGTTVLDR